MNKFTYGIHTVTEILHRYPLMVKSVYLVKPFSNNRLLTILNKCIQYKIRVNFTTKKLINRLTNNGVHQNIAAEVSEVQYNTENDLEKLFYKKNLIFLVLDMIQDTRNFGSCIRTACSAGVDAIIIPKYRSVKINSVSRKVSCGASEIIPIIRVTNLARTLMKMRKNNIFVIGTNEYSKEILYKINLNCSVALVIGGEKAGIRKMIRKCCEQLVRIPTISSFSSLNLSVTAGIGIFEIIRQRKFNNY
ncbi:hypothetical protein AOQ88_00845 [Candidatus Riesia sp. GBBU]|nr:hypothetical protein AOQ88_00845 [Candidatus Riesia sp. GBBU]